MKKKYTLYMIFGAISTLSNLGTQVIVKILLEKIKLFNRPVTFFNNFYFFYKNPDSVNKVTFAFLLQVLAGIAIGFFTKFVLDKFIVFESNNTNIKETAWQFFIYSSLAVITTIIFLLFEFSFKIFFHFYHSEIVGGLIGLVIGYTVKFFLDKKFVFKI